MHKNGFIAATILTMNRISSKMESASALAEIPSSLSPATVKIFREGSRRSHPFYIGCLHLQISLNCWVGQSRTQTRQQFAPHACLLVKLNYVPTN